MLTSVSRYDDVTSFFSDHQLTLDVTVEAVEPWKVVRFCTEVFSQHNIELLRILRGTAQTLSFRLDCSDHSDITRLDQAFHACDAPRIVDWTVTVGRKKKVGSNAQFDPGKLSISDPTPDPH